MGIWRISATTGEVLSSYAVPKGEAPRTGFNAAVIAVPLEGTSGAADTAMAGGARLFATHSQLGAWSWSLADPTVALPLLQPIAGVPNTIRCVCVDRYGRVLLAADDEVYAFSAAGERLWQTGSAGAAIYCLAPLDTHLYAGTGSGTLVRCELPMPGEWLVVHRALAAIETVQARRWDDLVELVVPAGAEGVCGVYATEGIVSRLLHARAPIRRAWACDDALVGLTEQRDRLIVLSAAMVEHAGTDVPIARLLGRSIQDACIVTARAGEEVRLTEEGGRTSHEGSDA